MELLIIIGYTILTMTLLKSDKKWVSIVGFMLFLPLFLRFFFLPYLWAIVCLFLTFLIIFPFYYVHSRRKDGISMIFERGSWEDRISRVDGSHVCIDKIRELEKQCGYYTFIGMLKAYTGNKLRVEQFLLLIQGAITEITEGWYVEPDRKELFIMLCDMEQRAIKHYYNSFLSFFPWGIRMKHNVYFREELLSLENVQTIKVPLRYYRNMQYTVRILSEEKNKNLGIKRSEEDIQREIDNRAMKFFLH